MAGGRGVCNVYSTRFLYPLSVFFSRHSRRAGWSNLFASSPRDLSLCSCMTVLSKAVGEKCKRYKRYREEEKESKSRLALLFTVGDEIVSCYLFCLSCLLCLVLVLFFVLFSPAAASFAAASTTAGLGLYGLLRLCMCVCVCHLLS